MSKVKTEPKRLNIEVKRIKDLKPAKYNPRTISKQELAKLAKSIETFGYVDPIIWNKKTKNIVGGHQRVKALIELGRGDELIEVVTVDLTPAKEKSLNIALNKIGGQWQERQLAKLLDTMEQEDIVLTGFDDDEVKALLQKIKQDEYKANGKNTLTEKFLAPPFSVLDAKQEYWQERKRKWAAMELRSFEGRDIKATNTSETDYMQGRGNNDGGSIFDPVLAEILYKWFVPEGGRILDPFAGGSVRGIVATKTGHEYIGVDLREEQVKANFKQSNTICDDDKYLPSWIVGDSLNIKKLVPKWEYNFVFSCPPYADLEQYSDDKRDISNMAYDEFLKVYRAIIKETCDLLAPDSFACFVVGDIRDKKGIYRNFVSHTIEAFEDAGLGLYNEIIYVTPLGTLPIRASSSFKKGRKVGKAHQNVLVFIKGDPKKAAAKLSQLDYEEQRANGGVHGVPEEDTLPEDQTGAGGDTEI